MKKPFILRLYFGKRIIRPSFNRYADMYNETKTRRYLMLYKNGLIYMGLNYPNVEQRIIIGLSDDKKI